MGTLLSRQLCGLVEPEHPRCAEVIAWTPPQSLDVTSRRSVRFQVRFWLVRYPHSSVGPVEGLDRRVLLSLGLLWDWRLMRRGGLLGHLYGWATMLNILVATLAAISFFRTPKLLWIRKRKLL